MANFPQGRGASLFPPPIREANKRPVYLIAHRCNDLDDIDTALQNGANAIEVDVRNDQDSSICFKSPFRSARKSMGVEWFADHDGIFPTSTELSEWLEVAQRRSASLAALYLDIKTPTYLESLRAFVEPTGLPDRTNVIYSTASFDNVASLNALPVGKQGRRDGVMIDEGENASKVLDYFQESKKTGSITNYWYGSGISSNDLVGTAATWAGHPGLQAVRRNLKYAVDRREAGTGASKVIAWTSDELSQIKDYFLNVKVDGVMVEQNTVASAADMIKKSPDLRLANSNDPPFEVFKKGASTGQSW